MSAADPIILVAYLLCLVYFIYKIIDSFNDEFTIKLDEKLLEEQLEKRSLKDLLSISFGGMGKRYEFNTIKDLAVSISNKSGAAELDEEKPENAPHSIYVDWDQSTFTDLEKRARRVTRLMPGTTLDLFQTQVYSTVSPNTTLKEKITAEDLLQRKGERKDDKLDSGSPMNLEVEVTKPLIDLKPEKPSDGLKPQLAKFKKRTLNLEFSLDLAFRIVGPSTSLGGDRVHILCKFILEKLPWYTGVPWNPR